MSLEFDNLDSGLNDTLSMGSRDKILSRFGF